MFGNSDEKKYDLEDPQRALSVKFEDSHPLPIQEDAVFGEITEDGPNYRNVRASKIARLHIGLQSTGGIDGNGCPDDEDASWLGCSIDSVCLRRPRPDPRYHLLLRHCYHHDLVRLHGWSLQTQAFSSLRH